jgi:hypothetical protein
VRPYTVRSLMNGIVRGFVEGTRAVRSVWGVWQTEQCREETKKSSDNVASQHCVWGEMCANRVV